MWNFFQRNHIPYNLLLRGDLLLRPPAKSIGYGVSSLTFQKSPLWHNFSSQVTESQTIEELNTLIPASHWQRQRWL